MGCEEDCEALQAAAGAAAAQPPAEQVAAAADARVSIARSPAAGKAARSMVSGAESAKQRAMPRRAAAQPGAPSQAGQG
jgi:hypothetical protein